MPVPNPTPKDLEDPLFSAIWNVIKTWDISTEKVHDPFRGTIRNYTGGNGSHVMMILNEVRKELRNKNIDELLQ